MERKEVMELIAAENVRSVRDGVLNYLESKNIPNVLGHAAILSIADDINRNERAGDRETLGYLVDNYHEKVILQENEPDVRSN